MIDLEDFLVKRTASHGIELLGLLTLHVSPYLGIGRPGQSTGAGHALIEQIADSLKQEGLLEKDAQFGTLDEVLNGLEKTSSQLADTFNMPPVTLAGMRREWQRFGRRCLCTACQFAKFGLVGNSLERNWWKFRPRSISRSSCFVRRSPSATLAELPPNVLWLSRAAQAAAKRTGQLLGETLLDHYVLALNEITADGFLAYFRRQFRPYLSAAALQFAPANESSTEKLLRKK